MRSRQKLSSIRVATFLFPPLGLVLFWLSRHPGTQRKILGTIGVLLYTVVYAAAVIGLLILFTGLQIEWLGGFPPVLTYAKTLPNYDALEADRRRKPKAPPRASEPSAPSSYWTSFRGPNRDGHYVEQPINTRWPTNGLPLLWQQPIGGGYASFSVAEGLAFTIEQRRQNEVVAAYDMATGREMWTHSYTARFSEWMGGEGPRATPTLDAKHVYSLGAEGDLHCFEAANGKLVWRRNILMDAAADNLRYAMAASPLIVDDQVVVLPGGTNGHSVAAYNKLTGKPAWSALDDQQAYTSPMLVDLAGQRQILVVTASRALGLSTDGKKVFWEYPWRVEYENAIAQPLLLGTNRFMLSAGYGTGAAAVEIERTPSGFHARTLWRNKFLKNKFSSSVLHDGYIYGLDEDILTCLDASTGARKWKDGRYGYGQLLLASGHLVILSGLGELALVRATSEGHQELARFQAIHGKTWNHPAIAGGRLLVRNAVEAACFDITARAGIVTSLR
jgi:outer membrane protein assembly factor BamB